MNLFIGKSVLPYRVRSFVLIGMLLIFAAPALPQARSDNLAERSLEDLMNIEVTSVSKKEQKVSRTSSAIFVITAEDIRNSGADQLADVLRMVPGVEVAQLNASAWGISVRGFNGQYSNKLLVLVDGRTVYSPMFSGVYWNSAIVPLEEIDRIEVVRGPGASVWGANAVNGVINIITKKASTTQGGLLTVSTGTRVHGAGTLRYGGRFGERGNYRLFTKGFDRSAYPSLAGGSGKDDWQRVNAGFRIDLNPSHRDTFTMEGDAYKGNTGELATSMISISPPLNGVLALRERFSGWNLLSRWKRVQSDSSETSLQVYFERTTRGDQSYGFGLNTFDVDFQHHVAWTSRQDLVWGLGYRLNSDGTVPTSRIVFTPTERTTQLFSAFVQDEITIRPERLFFTAGTKLEHDEYIGIGVEPSVHVTWTPSARQTFWAATSLAQRTPSRSDREIRENFVALLGPDNLPLVLGYAGSPRQRAERESSFEAGYRTKLSSALSVDAAWFFNRYEHLVSLEPGVPQLESTPAPAHLILLNTFANLSHGETHGFEIYADWKVTRRWTLNPGYAFLAMHIHRDAGSQDLLTGLSTEGSVPNHQAQLRSHMHLPLGLQWNTAAFFVGSLPALTIPAYTRMDSNLVWQAGERFSISLVGQDLLRDEHVEYSGPNSTVQSDFIPRRAYVKLSFWF
jgi:iron complex outermembrane recepter protein